jgi:hypothetical protein
MAEQGSSKAFGEYTGQRVSAVPEGFLSAYAQVAKNYQSIGEDVGKGVGKLIADYQAKRMQEDALNEQTKSPVFLEGLNKSLTGIAAKKKVLTQSLTDAGYNFETGGIPALEDDPSNPQNTPEEIRQQVAMLAAYDAAEKDGISFLKDPSKLDNKKKLQLIGTVTSVNGLFDKEKEAADTAKTDQEKALARAADLRAKTLASDAAEQKRGAEAYAAVRPDSKEAKNVVAAVINSASTRTVASARDRLQVLENEMVELDRSKAEGKGFGITKAQEVEYAILQRYITDERTPTTNTAWAEGEDRTFMSPESATERIAELDKEIQTALTKGGDVAGLTQMRNDLQMELDVSGESGYVYSGNFDTVEQLYNKGQTLARNYRSALSHISELTDLTSKAGGVFIPPMNEQDKQSLMRMVALGTNDVEDISTGMRYKIGDNGELLEVPLSKEDIERLAMGEGLMSEEKKSSEQLKAMQLAAQTQQRQFGKAATVTATFPKDANNPKAGTHELRRYKAEQYETVLYVQNRPDLTIQVAGTMAGDGTSTNNNVRELREGLVEQNKSMNALAKAQAVLMGPNGKIKTTLTEPEKAEFAAQIYEVKRGLGKGLGPLSVADYSLINTKIATPTPFGIVNINSPNFVKDFLQATFWEDYARNPQTYYDGLNRIMTTEVEGIKRGFSQGIGVTAVDNDYKRVDGHFAVRSGIFMDDEGKIAPVYMNERDGKPIYLKQAVDALKTRPVAIGATRNAEIIAGKTGAVNFDAAVYAESMNDPILAVEYQTFVRANSRVPSTPKTDSAYKKWLEEEYKPAWANLAKYLNAQGIPNDVLNGYQFHLGLNPDAR